jgi:hypothetical protein
VDPRLVVDSSLAHGVVHRAMEAEVSLVIVVERDGTFAPTLGTWAEAVADAAPAPVLMVRGQVEKMAEVSLLHTQDGADLGGAAATLAAELGVRLGGEGVEVREAPAGAWPSDLGEGHVTIAPVSSWELLGEVQTPATGALVLVPAPAVPIAYLLEDPAATPA